MRVSVCVCVCVCVRACVCVCACVRAFARVYLVEEGESVPEGTALVFVPGDWVSGSRVWCWDFVFCFVWAAAGVVVVVVCHMGVAVRVMMCSCRAVVFVAAVVPGRGAMGGRRWYCRCFQVRPEPPLLGREDVRDHGAVQGQGHR